MHGRNVKLQVYDLLFTVHLYFLSNQWIVQVIKTISQLVHTDSLTGLLLQIIIIAQVVFTQDFIHKFTARTTKKMIVRFNFLACAMLPAVIAGKQLPYG